MAETTTGTDGICQRDQCGHRADEHRRIELTEAGRRLLPAGAQ